MRKLIALALLSFAVSGCMIGPDYRRPTVEAPQNWRVAETDARELANTAWWGQFNDPVLNDLVAVALKENKDLQIAAARVEEFAGRYGFVRADLFPQVGAGAAYSHNRSSERIANAPSSGYDFSVDSYSTTLNASWELDVWGRIRRNTETARAQLLASEEGRRAVILSLVSSVAGSYVNLRDLDRQLEIARDTVKLRKESLGLFTDRFEGGIISELELAQVKSQYEEALATIPQFEKAIVQQENAISVLLGRNPGPIPRGKTIEQLTLPAIPAGLPSDLLERRPDIRRAEQNLIAANAQIGAAKAAYFPAITLTGFFGFASADLSDLFTGPAKVWNFTAPLTAPIFTAGKIAGDVKAAEAVQQQALLGYQQSIQTAFREVDDSLIDQSKTRDQLTSQASQVESLRKYAELARLRYDNGYTSYIEVLDAERSLFNVQLSYYQTKGALYLAMINLYKAMGGGWVANAEQLAAQSGVSAAYTPRPCADEFERFCKDVQPGLGLLIVCLDQHRAELSPACREKVGGALSALDKAKQDCSADIAAYCAGVKPGGGRLIDCLKKQPEKLAPACRSHVQHYAATPLTAPVTGK
jgi:multidrug efflux system outer membrane protein